MTQSRDTRPYRILSGMVMTAAFVVEELIMRTVQTASGRTRAIERLDQAHRVANGWISRVFTDH
jgi:hypothetical protein